MEVENTCKHCNCIIEDDSFICNDKTFNELVNECKNNRKNNHQCKIEIEKLGKAGVIKWLLQNATPLKINSEDINKIVDKCVFSSENDMIEILKNNLVYVKLTKETDDADEYPVTTSHERCALEDAVKTGNSEIISWILNLSINDKFTQFEIHPFIVEVVDANRLDNLQKLVSLGAQVSYTSYCTNQDSALDLAAKLGHIHILKWIFDNKLVSKDHLSCIVALHKALEHEQYDIIEYLIDIIKVDINSKCKYNSEENVIHKAAKLGNINVLKWLLDKGAILLAKDTYGHDIMETAVDKTNLNMLKWLSNQGVDLTERKNRSCTLLASAAYRGNIECTKYLLHKGFDVNAKNNNDNQTALQIAVTDKDKLELVKLLLAHGADVNVVDCDNNTLLHSASSNLELLKLLVPLGIDIYATNNEKENILQKAANENNAIVVEWLLELGMDVIDVLKCSYRWLQASYERYDKSYDNTMLELCIKYMTNIDQEYNGYTLLLNAAKYPEAVEILLKYKPNVNASYSGILYHTNVLMSSLSSKDKECKSAYSLIEAGADIKAKGKDGGNILYCALETQNIEFISKLIALGVDVNTRTYRRNTILGEAVHIGNREIINLLLESGANINGVDSSGESAISNCRVNSQWDIIKYLIEKGADPNNYGVYSSPLLFQVIESQNLESITWLLNHNANPNIVSQRNDSVLHHCFKSFNDTTDRLKCMKLLLDHDANVNGLNKNEETLIFNVLNNLELVDLLMRNGANINKQDKDGCTVLHKALQSENFENNNQHFIKIVLKFIYNGANVNVHDNKGITPLHLAVSNKHCSDIARLLVERGAKVNARDSKGNSVLHYACQGELAMWLCEKGANINAKNNDGVSVLHGVIKRLPDKSVTTKLNVIPLLQLCTTSNKSIIINNLTKSLLTSIDHSRYMIYLEFLVNKVQNVDDNDFNGMTPMHYAVAKDNVYLAQILFSKGANILNKSLNGNTLLHSSASAGSLNVVTYLLENMKHELLLKGNNANETPLHLAVMSNHVNIVKLLLKHGVEVDQKNDKGMTALHLACKNGNLEIVKLLLLSNGANLYETCSNSYTPIHMAVQYSKFNIFEYLLEFESKNPNNEYNVNLLEWKTILGENLLHIAAKYGRLHNVTTKIIKYLIINQVYPIDSVDKLGNSALHYACCTYVSDAVELLVGNGANINLKNKTGNTPMHFAAKTAKPKIIKFLLENGGNAKAKNHKGNTPIHIAAAYDKHDRIIKYMVEKKEDYYIKNRKGNCPLHNIAGSKRKYTLCSFFCKTPPYKMNIINNKAQTPLHIALKIKQYNYAQEFLNVEVINMVDIHGNTPLHIYLLSQKDAKNDDLPIFRDFLVKGVDLTIRNNNGITAMHIALMYLEPSSIKYLLPYLSDVNIKDKDGLNILHTALYRMDLNIIQELFKTADYNSKTDINENYLHFAIENPYLNVLKWIIPKCKSMINEFDSVYGDTPLLKCVRENFQIEVVKLFVDNGADIHAVDNLKCSLLHLSCIKSNIQLMDYFIDLGVDVNITGIHGYTVLHYAVMGKSLHIIKKLINKGANINAVNKNGESILHIAAKYDNINVVKYLILEAHCDYKLKCSNGKTAYELARELGTCPNVVFWMLNNDYL